MRDQNIRTPVSRVGNKTSLLHIICKLFPLRYNRFVDVFGGSGSVLLGKPEKDPFEVYNDIDRNLVNLFQCMKTRTMALIRELGFCNLNSREDYEALVKFFKDEEFKDNYLDEEIELTRLMLPPEYAEKLIELRLSITHDYDVRKAAMYLKLLRYSYASSGKSFASQPYDIRKLFPLIQQAGRRLTDVVIENQDFEKLIRHYDRKDTFFYLDPPYYSTEGMYPGGFGKDDHKRMRDLLNTIKGFCLISYNDCPETRGLYMDYDILSFSRPHSMAQRYEAGKEFKELLIANYDLLERVNNQPKQLTLFDNEAEKFDYNKILRSVV